jgi:ATP-binding cassette subfamily B protein
LSAIAILVLPIVNKAQYAKDELIRIDREHLDGIRVVHAYNGYEKQKERFEEANKRITDLLLRYDKSSALFAPFSNMVMYSLTVIIYIMGAYIVADSAKSLRSSVSNEMIVFVSMLSMLISSCIYLIIIMVLLPNASVSLKRIAQVLNKKTMIMDPEEAFAKDPAICGTLEFRNVSFMYPGSREYAIRDISFRMEKGETVAIVGGTGSGKTTLLNLIPRLYEATEGEILVDGVDIKKMKLKDLRNIFGYVPQKSFLFSGTIVSNIDFGDNGKLKKTIEEIVKASKLGKADEFIRAKEGGYNAHVEEGGSNFSGGQRQRLTISRAICRDPEIFLFDDSFSALDYKTDKTVREGLKETLSGASVLMVAQRISTIRSADRIIVLDNGRMVGMGTHDELMTSCNVYREIVLSQTDTEATG